MINGPFLVIFCNLLKQRKQQFITCPTTPNKGAASEYLFQVDVPLSFVILNHGEKQYSDNLDIGYVKVIFITSVE